MGLIYHYTRFETFMAYIWPSGFLRTNFLRDMNDPREMLGWSFGSTNLPYEKIFEGYYSDKTVIDCQLKYGNIIKDKFQILCFSGAQNEGWNNEMMWAHYGGMHSGVCLEFDEDILLDNLATKYPEMEYHLENVSYSNKNKNPWINWQPIKSVDEDMRDILSYLVKDMTLTKSNFWEKEDERRLVCKNVEKQLFIPIKKALKTVHLGVTFNKNGKEMVESVFRILNGRCNLSIMIYQHNRFERWGIRLDSTGKIITCDFEDMLLL